MLKRSKTLLAASAFSLACLKFGPKGGNETESTLDKTRQSLWAKSGWALAWHMNFGSLLLLEGGILLETDPSLHKLDHRIAISLVR